jgi:hypothetical protein
MKFLKNHPFGVEAFFESSLVLTFAVPKEELVSFIPAHLTLDTFKDEWAFIAVAMVQTKGLRPKGFPSFIGNDFFLIGYRIFVRYTNKDGRRLRGLYIIKSETDKKKMAFFGNLFTHYNYTTTDISQTLKDGRRILSSVKSNFEVVIADVERRAELPPTSPFTEWKEARRFAGPLPHTFTYNEAEDAVLIILGIRQNWNPKPVQIKSYRFDFLDSLNLKGIVLANAFEIKNVPYHWEKGRLEKW